MYYNGQHARKRRNSPPIRLDIIRHSHLGIRSYNNLAECLPPAGLFHSESNSIQECLHALAFEEMHSRFHNIEPPAEGTCEWLPKHEYFKRWLSKPRGLLWIKGKPGSGKSTVMSFAIRNSLVASGEDSFVFSFFFHGRGNELQRHPLGLYRYLVHQLLMRFPGALPELIDFFDEQKRGIGVPGEKWQWPQEQLRKCLASIPYSDLG